MRLANILAARRQALGLSLQKAATAAGITKAHLREMERGKSANPCVSTLAGLGAALKVSPDALFSAALRDGVGRAPRPPVTETSPLG